MLWYLVVLVKILSFQAIGLEVEDYLSQKRYEWKIGRSCHEDTQSLENSKSCLFENPKYDLVRDGDAVAKKQSQQNEKFFFDEASREYVSRNICWESKVKSLAPSQKQILVDDINLKLPRIRELLAQIKKLETDRVDIALKILPVAQAKGSYERPQQLIDFDDQIRDVEAKLDQILSLTWVGSHFVGREVIIRFAKKSADEINLDSLQSQVLNPIVDKARFEQLKFLRSSDQGIQITKKYDEARLRFDFASQNSVTTQKKKNLDDKELAELRQLDLEKLSFHPDDRQKIDLFRENGTTQLFKTTEYEFTQETDLFCRLEGKYGEGRKMIDRYETGAFLALSLLVPMGPYLAAARGKMTIQMARVLAFSAGAGLNVLSTFKQVKNACPEGGATLALSKSCSADSMAVEVAHNNCLLAFGMSLVPVATAASKSLLKTLQVPLQADRSQKVLNFISRVKLPGKQNRDLDFANTLTLDERYQVAEAINGRALTPAQRLALQEVDDKGAYDFDPDSPLTRWKDQRLQKAGFSPRVSAILRGNGVAGHAVSTEKGTPVSIARGTGISNGVVSTDRGDNVDVILDDGYGTLRTVAKKDLMQPLQQVKQVKVGDDISFVGADGKRLNGRLESVDGDNAKVSVLVNGKKQVQVARLKQVRDPVIETAPIAPQVAQKVAAKGEEVSHVLSGGKEGSFAGKTESGEYYGKTDIGGGSKKTHEDSILFYQDKKGDTHVAVFDGLGGKGGGDTASDTAAQFMRKKLGETQPDSMVQVVKDTPTAIAKQFQATGKGNENMGTTVSGFTLDPKGKLTVVNAGDSRVVILRKDAQGNYKVLAQTKDHSTNYAEHPNQDPGLIYNYCGIKDGNPNCVTPASGPIDLKPGDRVIAATDGLWKVMDLKPPKAGIENSNFNQFVLPFANQSNMNAQQFGEYIRGVVRKVPSEDDNIGLVIFDYLPVRAP